MPKYRNTCLLCNRVSSDLVQHRILFCNAIDDCRKELWETIIELQGHSAFNRMRCSDLLTQCNYITCMFVKLKDAVSVSFRSELFTSYILTIFKQRNLLP